MREFDELDNIKEFWENFSPRVHTIIIEELMYCPFKKYISIPYT